MWIFRGALKLYRRIKITTIQIFEPASCCSADVCDTETNQGQTSFPTDVEWAKQQGATIENFNLAQQPTAFENNSTTKAFLEHSGADALPLILVGGEVALAGRYPSRDELARWADIKPEDDEESSCCGGCC